MSDQPEKLDLRSHDIAEDKRQELLRLFPEVRTEGGKLDFERLKQALGEAVDVGKERYGMNWPGKADCFKTIQAPSMGTLRPCPVESVNFQTTENLIIEGDNLEVLKLLQKSYLGQVKMIYIDPPYNTGNDFIYPDNYTESLQTYLEYTEQVDAEGRKFGTNTDADGRFHSKWLNMMYPRLYLARNLLKDEGMILISIDDAEVENLRKAGAEVFGEENLIACLVCEKGRKNDAKLLSVGHDNIWMGVSVENGCYRGRIDHLRATGASVKFLSLEPLLGSLPNLDLSGVDWGIVGGESGPSARPMDPAWVTDLRDQCCKADVPIFFKQWGGRNKKQAGRVLEGRVWDEMPVCGRPAGFVERGAMVAAV